MYIVDDPTLALITRFGAGAECLDVSDQEFFDEQARSVKHYLEQFPAEEREKRALDWIEDHARDFRVAWQRRVVSERLSQRRCQDCPLIHEGPAAHCQIHARWSGLLQDYVREKISSREYVRETLRLLNEHKSELKVTLRRQRQPNSQP